jgi:acyl carrier protein
MIKDQVVKLMIDNLLITPTEEQTLKPETTFEDLAVDEQMMYDLILSIEDEFNITIPKYEEIKTVGGFD